MNTWIEIIYDGRGYKLSCARERPSNWVLVDEAGEEILSIEGVASPQVELHRALPLPLLVMAAVRIVDQTTLIASTVESMDAVS